MSPTYFLLLLFSSLTFLISSAQDRAPHGIAYENPMDFSPSAYDFFHPNNENSGAKDSCGASNCSPLPLAAQVEATEAHESKYSTSRKGNGTVGAGGIAGIVLGVAFAVMLAMGAYSVLHKRRMNMNRANNAQPNA